MEADVAHDPVDSPSRLPRHDPLRHFSWGLVAAGVLLVAFVWDHAYGEPIKQWLLDKSPPYPRPGLKLDLGRTGKGVALAYGLAGSAILAVTMAVVRCRWWWGLLLGLLLGLIAALGVAWQASPRYAGAVHAFWVFGGLVGGLCAAIRRRWGI